MNIKTRVMADLSRPSVAYVVYAKQWDKLSRYVELVMFTGGIAWTPPTGATYEVRGLKPDNTVLKYSVDEAGNAAVSISGNVATITLAQQTVACPGDTRIELCIKSGDEILTSFAFILRVEQSALADISSTNYINPALTTFIPSVSEEGIISWTNDGGLDNPEPRNVRGPTGAEIVSTQFIGTDQSGGNIYRQTFDNGETAEFVSPRGPAGEGNVKTVAGIGPDSDGDVPLTVGTSLLDNEAVTAVKIASGAVSTLYTATIPHTAWGAIESNGSTYASVSVPGILGSDSPIIDLKVMDITGVANRIKANKAWCAVFQASTASAGGSIGFRATEIPEMDLPIQILCIRK